MTSIQSPDNNGSVVDGSTVFHEHRVESVKTMMGSKATPTNDQVANNHQSKSNNTLTDGGGGPTTTGHSKYDPSRKRCSISVHGQHNLQSSNGDAIRPGGAGGVCRELSPQSLRIHRKSSHDIRILGADGEMLLHEGGGKMPTVVKPIKLKSITTKAESYDTLHGRATDVSILNDLVRYIQCLCLCMPASSHHIQSHPSTDDDEGAEMVFDIYSATKWGDHFCVKSVIFSKGFRSPITMYEVV